jgi:DNA-binding SARP family transcriptional activator/predicted ATPase
MTHLTLTCLGGFSASQADEPITDFRSAKTRALLVYLAVENGRAHQRDSLIDLFWPEQTPDKANANFRQSLSRLQRVIGNQDADPPFLFVTRESVQWNLDSPYDLDVDGLLNGIDSVLALTNLSQAKVHLQAVLDLHRGDFLAGLYIADAPEFEHWLTIMREQLHQQVEAAIEHTVSLAQQSGDYAEMARLARHQLARMAWDETAHRRLMLALARQGRRAEALAQFEHCFEALEQELGVEPDEITVELYEQIAQGELRPEDVPVGTIPSTQPQHQLPASATQLIGRTDELAQITERLQDPNSRLITIVGPGGGGKTSLALESAASLSPPKTNGAAFVSFTGVEDETEIGTVISQALGLLPPTDIEPLDHLLAYLQPLDLLLVLDNFEDLLQSESQDENSSPAQRTIASLLEGAPQVTLLITSRVRLNLAEEWVYSVAGLSVPPEANGIAPVNLADLEKYSAVEMYVHHAQRVHADFSLTPQNWRAVVRICQIVGGLPLGLQLASAWVRVLSCVEICDEMEQRLDFLSTTSPQIPARHRSLYALFDSSWRHLSSPAQEAVLRLSIFRGPFDRQAAAHISGASLSVLAEIIDHSFIQRAEQRRYVMHPLMRQIAFERLASRAALLSQTQHDHARYFAGYIQARQKRFAGPEIAQTLNEIETCFADIASAWTCLVQMETAGASDSLQLVGEMVDVVYEFCRTRGRLHTAVDLFGAALGSLSEGKPNAFADEPIQARLLGCLGATYAFLGNQEQARKAVDRAIEIAEALLAEDALSEQWVYVAETLGFCLWCHLYMVNSGDDLELLDVLYQRGLAICGRFGHERGTANLHNIRGVIAHNMGELSQARELYQVSHRFASQNDDYRLLTTTLHNLGKISEELGLYAEGLDWYAQSMQYATALNDTESLAYISSGMGRIHFYQGQYPKAVRLTKDAVRDFTRIGFQRGVAFGNHLLGEISCFLEEYDETAAYLAAGMAVCKRAGYQVEAALIATAQGHLALRLGQEERAELAGREALAYAHEIQSRSIEGPARTLLGEIALHRGDLATARRAFEQAIAIGREIHAPLIWQEAQTGLAEAAIQLGTIAEAQALLQEVLAHEAAPFHLRQRIRSLQSSFSQT